MRNKPARILSEKEVSALNDYFTMGAYYSIKESDYKNLLETCLSLFIRIKQQRGLSYPDLTLVEIEAMLFDCQNELAQLECGKEQSK